MSRATTIVRRAAVRPDRVADTVSLDHAARAAASGSLVAEGGLGFDVALVKAAAAAAAAAAQPSSPCRRRRRGAVAPLVFPVPEEDYAVADPVSPVAAKPAQKRRVACRGGRATRFSPDLTAIPESE